MNRIESLEDLNQAREAALEKKKAAEEKYRFQIKVSLASCGIAVGAQETLEAIHAWIGKNQVQGVQVSKIGCLGLCSLEPVIQVFEANRPPVTYGKVSPEVVHRIFEEHIEKGLVVHEYVIENI